MRYIFNENVRINIYITEETQDEQKKLISVKMKWSVFLEDSSIRVIKKSGLIYHYNCGEQSKQKKRRIKKWVTRIIIYTVKPSKH